MQTQRVKIETLVLDPANVRRHPSRNLDAIKGSLTRFGQQKPVIVDSKGIVIAGNGTVMAAKDLGWEHINILRTTLEGSEATAYAIADNRTAELAEWDDAALAQQIAALQTEDEELARACGFANQEIERLIETTTGIAASQNPVDEWQDMPEFQQEAKAERTIHVHFERASDSVEFAERLGLHITEQTKTVWFKT